MSGRPAKWVERKGTLVRGSLVFLLGCGPIPPSPAQTAGDLAVGVKCHVVIDAFIANARTCEEAEKAINANKACKEAVPNGIDLQCDHLNNDINRIAP